MNIQRSEIKEKANYFKIIYFILELISIILLIIYMIFLKNNRIYVTIMVCYDIFIMGMFIGSEMLYDSIMN
uniref:Uncharacterized protein n=1 Tax=viral metagenome TaxID=1070528 RepID=A0A6C0H508_9ZZZZ